MIAGLDAYNSIFLNSLNQVEKRITTANEQLSTGYRVNQPSDDPGSIGAILQYQGEIDSVTQIKNNLSQASTIATLADSTLASATNMLNQLTSIAAQGSSSTSTAKSNAALAQQVQGIDEQLVGLANTTFKGHYIFGGDDSSNQPYTFNWSVPGGVVQNNTSSATVSITNADGDSAVVPGQTAQQIFDARNSNGSAATSNIFQNVWALGQALQNNNQSAIQAAATSLQSSVVQLGQAGTSLGNTLTWLQQSTDNATTKLTGLLAELSSLRDADAAQAATDLTSATTAEQAAVEAHSSSRVENLFDFMG